MHCWFQACSILNDNMKWNRNVVNKEKKVRIWKVTIKITKDIGTQKLCSDSSKMTCVKCFQNWPSRSGRTRGTGRSSSPKRVMIRSESSGNISREVSATHRKNSQKHFLLFCQSVKMSLYFVRINSRIKQYRLKCKLLQFKLLPSTFYNCSPLPVLKIRKQANLFQPDNIW